MAAMEVEASKKPPPYQRCPNVCGETGERPDDRVKGCETCPMRHLQNVMHKYAEANLKKLCTKRDGTPGSDFSVETLERDLGIADAFDREVRGKGYGRDWDVTTARIVDILRNQRSVVKFADTWNMVKDK